MADPDATRIYKETIDAASLAAFNGDLAGLVQRIAVPCMFNMADRKAIATTSEELDVLLQDYAHKLAASGVVEEVETDHQASYMLGRRDMISGSHLTAWHYLDGTSRAPFGNRIVLLHYPDGWRVIWFEAELACAEIDLISADFLATQTAMLEHLARPRP